MADTQRTTVYLEPELHRAVRLQAVETRTSVSALINDALRAALADDLADLRAIDARRDEPVTRLQDLLEELDGDGSL